MEFKNQLEIIEKCRERLIFRFHRLTTAIAQLTAAGCIDAKEYWREEKYLYLLYSMKDGIRKKKYIGSHPLRIEEARQKLENFKDRLYHIEVQRNVQSNLDEIEDHIQTILKICSSSDSAARLVLDQDKYIMNPKSDLGSFDSDIDQDLIN